MTRDFSQVARFKNTLLGAAVLSADANPLKRGSAMPANILPLLRLVLYARDEANELGLQDVEVKLADVAKAIFAKLPDSERHRKDIAEAMKLLDAHTT